MKKVNVIIADDHILFADGLAQILADLPEVNIVAKVKDGKALLTALNGVSVDVILADINMPKLNGLAAAEQIIKQYRDAKIVFISMHYNERMLIQARDMGAYGYLLKDITAPELKAAIQEVINGNKVFELSKAFVAASDSRQYNNSQLAEFKITDRELEIINLIQKGYSSKRIASDLELSVYTVDTHRKNIHRKLQVQSTAELLAKISQYQFYNHTVD